ncbi:MAG: hypothetical protein KDA33_00130 [Phycisphaerales bacterium]|nr:hypothetical protein [Phycisphaerales bacterium]
MNSDEAVSVGAASAPRRRSRWFVITLCLMVCAFVVIVFQRHQIRLWWYVRALDASSGGAQTLQLYDRIAAELAASESAMLAGVRSDRSDVRLIAAGLVTKLDEPQAMRALDTLLRDDDEDVRGVAALMLAFDTRKAAWTRLTGAIKSDDTKAAAAAASVINRTTYDDAPCILVEALKTHASPQVRAQAAESLIVTLIGSTVKDPSLASVWAQASQRHRECGVYLALAEALADEGAFEGRLSYEREMDDVIAQAGARGIAVEGRGADGTDRARTVGGLIRSLLDEAFSLPADLYAMGPAEVAEALRRAVEQPEGDSSSSTDPHSSGQ